MTKQDIKRSMERFCDGSSMISISGIARYMGLGRDTVRAKIVPGLDYIESGRAKKYFVGDVADRIMEMRRA